MNLIVGPNASGKTSVLEALYVLGRGRSFRSSRLSRAVSWGSESATVVADLSGDSGARHRLGVGFGRNGLTSRVDGAPGEGIAQLAELFPVQVVDPNVHALVEGGPDQRRRFLDWGTFHVEHEFLPAWRSFRRALRQRNAVLKLPGPAASLLDEWDRTTAQWGERVAAARQRYLDDLAVYARSAGEALLESELDVVYYRGWSGNEHLEEVLVAGRHRDRAAGATQAGPHRADVRILLNGRDCRHAASRGQQKLVAIALVIAQIEHLFARRGMAAALLVDDPAAELDFRLLGRFLETLRDLRVQLFLTSVDPRFDPRLGAMRRFHVEHGAIETVL